MGHTEVRVGIGDPEGRKLRSVTALVDTGATFTVLPRRLGLALGLQPTGERVKVATAKGPDELDLAHALITLDGKKRVMPVLLSRGVARVLLGMITLEALQLKVNPVTQKVEEHTALLY